VHGTVVFDNTELDDLIIARSDGSPTYNFCVVIDDYDMQVTHVIRGDDHLNNTPRQINMLAALGAALPRYAHVPMILGPDGAKLSKRHGAVSVLHYRDEGYLPQALLNYLVRLGWSNGDQEIVTVDEMIRLFDIDDVNKGASAFNPEKLLWLNQQHIMRSTAAELVPHFEYQLAALGIDGADPSTLAAVISAQQERAKTMREMATNSLFFFRDVTGYDEKAARKNLTPDSAGTMRTVRESLADLVEWRAASIHATIEQVSTARGVGLGKVAQPIRVAVSGGAVSPPIDVTLEVLGRKQTLARLDRAIDFAEAARA
jgi:glutamyl-tRNA synthetase